MRALRALLTVVAAVLVAAALVRVRDALGELLRRGDRATRHEAAAVSLLPPPRFLPPTLSAQHRPFHRSQSTRWRPAAA